MSTATFPESWPESSINEGWEAVKKLRKMSEAEFLARVAEIGYVEASVESARRDGGVFDEAAIRNQAIAAKAAFARVGIDVDAPAA